MQAAARLTLVGDAERFESTPERLARYLRYEPATEQLLALDFIFFRLNPNHVRFIAEVKEMGWLEGVEWSALPQFPGVDERVLVSEESEAVRTGIRLLGVDRYDTTTRMDVGNGNGS